MEWTMLDFLLAFLTALLVLELYVFAKMIFLEKSSIYWDEKQQQIKTKSGKCLYNRREVGGKFTKIFQRIETLSQKIRKLEDVLPDEDWRKKCNDAISSNEKVTREFETRYQAQLQCGAKGHGQWVFVKKDLLLQRNCPELTGYTFQCEDCDLEITKTAKELTATEREALKKLKLL